MIYHFGLDPHPNLTAGQAVFYKIELENHRTSPRCTVDKSEINKSSIVKNKTGEVYQLTKTKHAVANSGKRRIKC